MHHNLAWAFLAITLLLAVLTVLLGVLNRSAPTPAAQFPIEEFVNAVTFSTIGALIATRRTHNPIGWIFCAIGLSHALSIFITQYAVYTLFIRPGALPLNILRLGELAWWAVGFGLLTFLFLLFPNGRLLSPRWRWLAWLSACGIALVVLPQAIAHWSLSDVQLHNEYTLMEATPQGQVVEMVAGAGFILMLISALVAVISLILRLRRATGIERQQLKWFTYAGALFVAARLMVLLLAGDQPSDPLPIVVGTLTIAGIPIAVGIAILKHRLYDVDVLINRTLVYGLLTASLALVYVGCVVLFRQLFAPLTGSSESAIVASTLAIAALFTPLRRRIQAVIDKRFYRRKYNAAQVLAGFSATVRDETDLDALTAEILRVVDETMQPAHVSLWLKHMPHDRSSAVEGKHV
jgi:hypothetical protein